MAIFTLHCQLDTRGFFLHDTLVKAKGVLFPICRKSVGQKMPNIFFRFSRAEANPAREGGKDVERVGIDTTVPEEPQYPGS